MTKTVLRSKPSNSRTAPAITAELSHVFRSFGNQQVLRDLSLKVFRGETLVLIGESGCGKSVTTKLLAGLLEASSGEISWEGRPLQDRSTVEMRRDRLRLGYLFQGAALFDSMNVFDNVAFGLRENMKLPESEVQAIVYDRLREVGLADDVAMKKPADLSGGMKKRVGMARALAMSPEVMIYDEPTTGLDPVMSGVINELILQTQHRRQVTSIVVTHDMTTVRHVADRVVMLYPLARLSSDESQIVFEGSCDDVFNSQEGRIMEFVRGDPRSRMLE